jgi:nucleotide-binding universal stress UspA family protein
LKVVAAPCFLCPSRAGPVMASFSFRGRHRRDRRAMTASLPLLQHARTVHLLSVQNHTELPSTADAAERALRQHGVQVECASVPERGSVGEAVLAFARQVDADLLIKGAYTQARLRRLIFGGATDYILAHHGAWRS